MKKKLLPPSSKTEFRESDFAGMKPHDKAQLSGSLNRLSEQLANTRQLLQDIEQSTSMVSAVAPLAPMAPSATGAPDAVHPSAEQRTPAPARSDDGTPVPP